MYFSIFYLSNTVILYFMHIPHLFLIVFTLLLFVFIRYRIIFCNTHFIIIGLVYALSFTPQMPVLSLQFYCLLQVSLNKDIQSFHLQSLLATSCIQRKSKRIWFLGKHRSRLCKPISNQLFSFFSGRRSEHLALLHFFTFFLKQ